MTEKLKTYKGVVDHVVDGDTVSVTVPAWRNTPFGKMDLRINGIDTPEIHSNLAKCPTEVQLGLAAKAYAQSLVKPGDNVTFTVYGLDKYARLDAAVTLPGKVDWAKAMIDSGHAKPYTGEGPKPDWCTAEKTA